MKLSPQQRRAVELVAAGLPTKAIAREMELSPRTVVQHLRLAYRKLGVVNRTQAAILMERGLC